MKKLILFFIAISPFAALAQNADSVWFVNNFTKKEVSIPMRDGAKLFTSVYIPNDKVRKAPYSDYPYTLLLRPLWRKLTGHIGETL
jgi:predicted acyl esterase